MRKQKLEWAIAGLKRNDFAEIEKIYRRWSPTWNFTKTDLEPVKRVFEEPRGIENALGYYWSFVRDAFSASGVETRRVLSAKTSVPTLSFFGELDGAIDQSAIESTRAWFTDHYKIVRVPNVGHFLHREAPQTFLNRTLEFIR